MIIFLLKLSLLLLVYCSIGTVGRIMSIWNDIADNKFCLIIHCNWSSDWKRCTVTLSFSSKSKKRMVYPLDFCQGIVYFELPLLVVVVEEFGDKELFGMSSVAGGDVEFVEYVINA